MVFHPLVQEQIRGIAEIQLQGLRQRLAERELGLEISESFMELLVSAGFDPVYGARPLKRAIQQELENPLAQRILAGEFTPGQTIVVDLENDQAVFQARSTGNGPVTGQGVRIPVVGMPVFRRILQEVVPDFGQFRN